MTITGNIKPIVAKETEDNDDSFDEEVEKESIVFKEDDSPKTKVLRSLSERKFTFRSIKGISKEIKLEEDKTNKILSELISEGLVEQTLKEKGIRFFITSKGREYLNWYNNTSYASLLENYKNKNLKK